MIQPPLPTPPVPPVNTEALGVFQADLIIRSAVIAAIGDLRANPYLLDFVFASLPRDPLTAAEYGQQEVSAAKAWFQKTAISVMINVNTNEVKFPCISIGLSSSSEVESEGTLGDIHYQPSENNDSIWGILAGPLTPLSYTFTTGIMTLPAISIILAPKMLVLDANGQTHPILEVIDETTIRLAPNLTADFTDMTIRPARPAYSTQIESTVYRETYSLGCHVDSEAVHLTYLHSIVIWALLRYKQDLLEARGFERSVLTSSDLKRDDDVLPEMLYSRYVTISGYVRQSWPKLTTPKIQAVFSDPVPNDSPIADRDPIEEFADQDPLTIRLV